eukprot:Selendium_serpulae@DN5970_c0_g1_i1.p1
MNSPTPIYFALPRDLSLHSLSPEQQVADIAAEICDAQRLACLGLPTLCAYIQHLGHLAIGHVRPEAELSGQLITSETPFTSACRGDAVTRTPPSGKVPIASLIANAKDKPSASSSANAAGGGGGGGATGSSAPTPSPSLLAFRQQRQQRQQPSVLAGLMGQFRASFGNAVLVRDCWHGQAGLHGHVLSLLIDILKLKHPPFVHPIVRCVTIMVLTRIRHLFLLLPDGLREAMKVSIAQRITEPSSPTHKLLGFRVAALTAPVLPLSPMSIAQVCRAVVCGLVTNEVSNGMEALASAMPLLGRNAAHHVISTLHLALDEQSDERAVDFCAFLRLCGTVNPTAPRLSEFSFRLLWRCIDRDLNDIRDRIATHNYTHQDFEDSLDPLSASNVNGEEEADQDGLANEAVELKEIYGRRLRSLTAALEAATNLASRRTRLLYRHAKRPAASDAQCDRWAALGCRTRRTAFAAATTARLRGCRMRGGTRCYRYFWRKGPHGTPVFYRSSVCLSVERLGNSWIAMLV